jgi:hypothetical protein
MIYPQRVLLPIGHNSRLKWPFGIFFKKSELAGQVWQPSSDYNGCLERFKLKKASNGHYDLQYLTYAFLAQCDHKTQEGGGKEI